MTEISVYLPKMKYNNYLFDFDTEKNLMPAGLVHSILHLPTMTIITMITATGSGGQVLKSSLA